MARRTKIYEGTAKILYEGPEPGTIVQHFKDDTTAFNAEKKAVIEGKGVLNNRLSEFFMTGLNNIGVPTHFIKRLNMREQLIRQAEIIPLEIVVRNYAAGDLSTRLGIDEGMQLPRPIVEYHFKNNDLGDPLVTEEHIAAFGWASQQDMDDILSLSLRVNDFMSGLMLGVGETDEQVIEYTWGDNEVTWTLVSASQLKAQDAGYTLTPEGDKTRVRFDIAIDLSVPMPGFILKRTMKGGVETATEGLRKQVLKVTKG